MAERRHPAWRPALGVALLVVALQMIILTAFAWPSARTAPRNLPVALVGRAGATEEARQGLTAAGFDVRTVADEQRARAEIVDRDVYGAIVLQPDGPRVLVASAASPAVAQLLPAAVARAAAVDTVPTEDIRAATAEDPRGSGLSASVLPLVITSIAATVALGLRVGSLLWRTVGALVFAAAGGLAVAAILQGWLGSIGGDYLANAPVLAVTLAAIALPMVGLEAAFGRLGLGLGAATVLLVGNPLSGLTSAPELLPEPWGDLGQLLPPGAGGTALRSVAFFGGAGATNSWIVLTCWAVAGLVLIWLGAPRRRSHPAVRLDG